MNHASTVVLFLLVAFVAFVAAKGTLKQYVAVLWGPTEAPLPKASSGGTSSPGGSSSLNTALSIAKVAGAFLGAP